MAMNDSLTSESLVSAALRATGVLLLNCTPDPDTEELIGLCGKHKNLYMSISGIIGWYQRAPYRGYHAIGTALQWMDSTKIVLGFDLPFDDLNRVTDYIRYFDMPEELQEILLDHVYSVDCRVRISKLTSKLISQKNS